MGKSPEKMPERNDLQLRWSAAPKPPGGFTREEKTAPCRRVEEYLDFLEEIEPAAGDEAPAKLYHERFELS